MIQELRTLLINGRSHGEHILVPFVSSVGLNDVSSRIMDNIIGVAAATATEIETHADLIFKLAYSLEDTKTTCERIFDKRYNIGGSTSWYSSTFSTSAVEKSIEMTPGVGDFIEMYCSGHGEILDMFYDRSKPFHLLMPTSIALAIYIKKKHE